MADISLLINGAAHSGWTSASITRSIEQAANGFSLGISQTPTDIAIQPGDACTLMAYGQTLITGYVDSVDESYSADSHDITVAGRDKTADIVDCSAILPGGGQLKNQTPNQIITALISPYGIGLVASGLPGAALPSFKIEEGESVIEAVNRVIKHTGALAYSDGAGNLVIGQAGGTTATATLEMAVNIEGLTVRDDISDVFSEYIIKGQAPATATTGQAVSQQVKGAASAGSRTLLRGAVSNRTASVRHRPLIVMADENVTTASATRQAAWEKSHRLAKSQQLTANVTGWLTDVTSGPVWAINQLIRLKSPRYNGFYLIVGATHILDDGGLTTELTLAPKDAYAPQPS
jgi:prophage tail gpP-like protein